jgi:hypothetical protein
MEAEQIFLGFLFGIIFTLCVWLVATHEDIKYK